MTGEREGMGWDGRKGGREVYCGMGFGRGGDLDISLIWDVLLLMILEVRHVMSWRT